MFTNVIYIIMNSELIPEIEFQEFLNFNSELPEQGLQ